MMGQFKGMITIMVSLIVKTKTISNKQSASENIKNNNNSDLPPKDPIADIVRVLTTTGEGIDRILLKSFFYQPRES